MPAIADVGADFIYAFGTAPVNVTMDGSGSAGEAGAAIASWLWVIKAWPDGSSPTWVDSGTTSSTEQSPQMTGLPSVGDVVYYLVVTDENGVVSEQEFENLPDSAVGVVGVTTENSGLRRLTEWEMFWAEHQAEWVDEIDRLAEVSLDTANKRTRLHFIRSNGASGAFVKAASLAPLAILPGSTDIATFSMVFWLRVDPVTAAAASDANIVDVSDDGSPRFRLTVNSSDLKAYIVNAAGTVVSGTATNALNDGQWHHIAVRGSSTEIRVYVDSALVIGPLTPSGTYSAVSEFTLFADYADANRLRGDIAGFAIYKASGNGVLSVNNVDDLFEVGRQFDLMNYTVQPALYWHEPAYDGSIENEGYDEACALTLSGGTKTTVEEDARFVMDEGLYLPSGASIKGPAGVTFDFPGGFVGTFDTLVSIGSGTGPLSLIAGDDSSWDVTGALALTATGGFTINTRGVVGVIECEVLDAQPPGTTQATVETTTIPANTFKTNGDVVEIRYLVDQINANACTLAIDTIDGGTIINDSRSTADNRTALVRITRLSATTARVELFYTYGTGTLYNPDSVVDTVADMTAAQTVVVKLTNGTAAGDMILRSKLVTYFGAM